MKFPKGVELKKAAGVLIMSAGLSSYDVGVFGVMQVMSCLPAEVGQSQPQRASCAVDKGI